MDEGKRITIKFPGHNFNGHYNSISIKNNLLVTNFEKEKPDKVTELMHILAFCYAIQWDSELVQEAKDAEAGEIITVDKHYKGVWPHIISFGELSFSSSDDVELEISWRYKEALVVP